MKNTMRTETNYNIARNLKYQMSELERINKSEKGLGERLSKTINRLNIETKDGEPVNSRALVESEQMMQDFRKVKELKSDYMKLVMEDILKGRSFYYIEDSINVIEAYIMYYTSRTNKRKENGEKDIGLEVMKELLEYYKDFSKGEADSKNVALRKRNNYRTVIYKETGITYKTLTGVGVRSTNPILSVRDFTNLENYELSELTY